MRFMLLSGSFHKRSISLGIIREIVLYLQGHECTVPRLDELPFYSEDLEAESKPKNVSRFIEEVSLCDGMIFCTPEYNHSIPAVLKNAIDWASRPAFRSPLKEKPVAIITQAVSEVGGARAQAHLKLILDSTISKIQPIHEMMISGVNNKFNESQSIIHDKTLERLHRHINDFVSFAGSTS